MLLVKNELEGISNFQKYNTFSISLREIYILQRLKDMLYIIRLVLPRQFVAGPERLSLVKNELGAIMDFISSPSTTVFQLV